VCTTQSHTLGQNHTPELAHTQRVTLMCAFLKGCVHTCFQSIPCADTGTAIHQYQHVHTDIQTHLLREMHDPAHMCWCTDTHACLCTEMYTHKRTYPHAPMLTHLPTCRPMSHPSVLTTMKSHACVQTHTHSRTDVTRHTKSSKGKKEKNKKKGQQSCYTGLQECKL